MQNTDANSLKYTISGSISVILVMIREMIILIPVNFSRELYTGDPPFQPSIYFTNQECRHSLLADLQYYTMPLRESMIINVKGKVHYCCHMYLRLSTTFLKNYKLK